MRRTTAALGVLALVSGLLASTPTPASAAGVTTHAWMALDAVDLVTDPQLKALLQANLGQVEGGAQFPDSGYWNEQFDLPGGVYGEEAHWQRFHDAYADQIAADPGCGDLTAPNGPCAARIAHMMGAMGHGIGDEVWDWLFEPIVKDFDEQYIPPLLEGFFGTNGAELQMDIVAIHDHGRPTSPDTPAVPAPPRLVEVFDSTGLTGITVEGIESGKGGMSTIRGLEAVGAPLFQQDIHDNMPNTAARMVTDPGGVDFAAVAIARAYETMWGRLLGDQPPTEVSITYPADGQADVPATGWDRPTFIAGASGGGARTRIAATLSYALPYEPSLSTPGSLPDLLPPGAMTLTDLTTDTLVPAWAGYPKVVPYGPDRGTHTIDLQPVGNLDPCTAYRVDVTDALIDAAGEPVVPTSWSFTTEGCDIPVTSEADAGAGSFREAVATANVSPNPRTIVFDPGLAVDLSSTVTYQGDHDLVVEGNGSTLDAGGNGRVLTSLGPAAVTLGDLVVTGGDTDLDGGGISVGGDLTIIGSTVVGNRSAGDGGGVDAIRDLTVRNSTIAANASTGEGGGIAVGDDVVLDHVTVAGNDAGAVGNGGDSLYLGGGPSTLTSRRSVLAGTLDDGDPDCTGEFLGTAESSHTFVAEGGCLLPEGNGNVADGDDPRLGPPRDNGSPPTMFPLAGSPVVDAIPAAECDADLTADQRGVARPHGPGCDLGAIEAVYPPHGLTDVPAWIDAAVAWLTSDVHPEPIMTGYPNGTFRGGLDITRAQFVRLLHREAGAPVVDAPHGLRDVPPWIAPAVRWAVEEQIMTGYPNRTFRPDLPVSRAQVVRAKHTLAGSPAGPFDPHGLSDVRPWVEAPVRWAVAHGVMAGYPDETFRPNRSISRAEVANADHRLSLTPEAWAVPGDAPATVPFVAP